MTSTSKTVSEYIARYYGKSFAQAAEQIETEILGQEASESDNTEPSSKLSRDEVVIMHESSKTRLLIHIRGMKLWIITITTCISVAILLFGQETVIRILHLISNIGGGW
jgi:hypothetical protein